MVMDDFVKIPGVFGHQLFVRKIKENYEVVIAMPSLYDKFPSINGRATLSSDNLNELIETLTSFKKD